MRVRNISKEVKSYMKIHRKHIGKTIVVHNLQYMYTVYNMTTNHCLQESIFYACVVFSLSELQTKRIINSSERLN